MNWRLLGLVEENYRELRQTKLRNFLRRQTVRRRVHRDHDEPNRIGAAKNNGPVGAPGRRGVSSDVPALPGCR